jgi:hypothetical protein
LTIWGGIFLQVGSFLGTYLLLTLTQYTANADTSSCIVTAGGAISCIGILDIPETFFEKTFTISGLGPSTITIQTYGFGGGMNAAGMVVPAGGFDALVALFSAAPEMILTDVGGNPIASVPGSTQFFAGCPPAGTRSIGGGPQCGDNRLSVSLMPGTYNLVLSDANYVPFAVSPGPPISQALSDGFADLTSGVFQTCTPTGDCVNDTGNFAVDILSSAPAAVPEPTTVWLLGSAVALMAWKRREKFLTRIR